MFQRYLPSVLGAIASLALSAAPLFAQDEPERPASLSSNLLMDEELAPKDEFTIDPAILTPPENATADELLEFVDSIQEKLPQPRSQEELYKLVDAFSQALSSIADKLLAMNDLTADQRQRAVQMKVVALTTRAKVDKEAADELAKFVDENLARAKTDEELVKAYQLKLQTLVASEDDATEKIEALVDEAFQREQEELQVFAIEVKANSFIGKVQREGEFDPGILEFVEGVIADKNRSARVKEKALEMKLVALIVASELEKEKEKEEDRNTEYAENAEKLFEELLKGEYSLDLKKTVYQLRAQILRESEDEEKLTALADDLAKQEDEELYALGVAVKGQLLIKAAQDSDEGIKALVEYADKIVEEAKTQKLLKIPSVGLKVRSFVLKNDNEGLIKYADEELALNPEDELKNDLIQVKLRAITSVLSENPDALDSYMDFIASLKDDEQYAGAIAQIYGSRFVSAASKIAEDKGDLAKFNERVEQFKKDLETCPRAITAIIMARQAIDQIGAANNNEKLFEETLDSIIDFCKVAQSEELNEIAQSLENMKAMQEQQKKAAQEAAEKAASEKADDEGEESGEK